MICWLHNLLKYQKRNFGELCDLATPERFGESSLDSSWVVLRFTSSYIDDQHDDSPWYEDKRGDNQWKDAPYNGRDYDRYHR